MKRGGLMAKFGILPLFLLLLIGAFALFPGVFSSAQHEEEMDADKGTDQMTSQPVQPGFVMVDEDLPPQPITGIASDTHLDKTPPRFTKGLDLTKMDWSYDCMECHDLIEAQWTRDYDLEEHDGIVLNHGNNRFCLNCHNSKNTNVFADYDGSEISEKNVVLLCAKCHGPKYRDWKAGVHGRRNGYWDTSKGPQTQLRCIQCHDPHNPVYKTIHPLPAPNYPRRASGAEHARKLLEEHSSAEESTEQ